MAFTKHKFDFNIQSRTYSMADSMSMTVTHRQAFLDVIRG